MSMTNAGTFSQAHFAEIPSADIQRSTFDRGCTYKTTMDAGYLVPFYLDDVLPGDTFDVEATFFGRLNTPIVPFMDDVYIDVQFFFVPNRLVWDNWEDFIVGPNDDNGNREYLVPYVSSGDSGFPVGSVADYFGIPPSIPGIQVDAMPFRAYELIFNEWYRDQNLISKVAIDKSDAPSTIDAFPLQKRMKRKDYFTSALPWPQKGPGVEFSLASSAPVVGTGKAMGLAYSSDTTPDQIGAVSQMGKLATRDMSNVLGVFPHSDFVDPSVAVGTYHQPETVGFSSRAVGLTTSASESGIVADLTEATAITISSFRMAYQMQGFFEQLARGGSRYIEVLRTMFNVTSPDARLQRPELIGGGSCRLDISAVPQTSATGEVTPQGNLAAYGTFNMTAPRFEKSFVEHGYVIGIMSVRTNLTYQQGVPRMFSRQTRFDYYFPAFAHLGEQMILRKEIYAEGTEFDDAIFGYQERYAEYRYGINKITGKLRSSDPQSLDVWHLSQYFENPPVLGEDFIVEDPPFDRVIAVTDEPQFYVDVRIQNSCTRPMPVYSVPGLITHL